MPFIWVIIFNPFTGFLLALTIGLINSYYKENSKRGKWKVNVKRLIFLGVPLFLIYCYMLKLTISQQWNIPFVQIPGVLAGYIIGTGFYKDDRRIQL
ncbi:hypothetical protein [Desulfolucanica intricata]|uniref:hypothetical protein n=1 Tax=Desulfolucanica intricata TaxID=1285191 RepID=UPI00082C447F|nr:hypothetical protein [Desulfolucanica intricata]